MDETLRAALDQIAVLENRLGLAMNAIDHLSKRQKKVEKRLGINTSALPLPTDGLQAYVSAKAEQLFEEIDGAEE